MSEIDPNLRLIEAILFAAAEPVDQAVLAARLPDDVDVEELLATLKAEFEGRGVNLVRVAGKWSFRTAEDLGFLLREEREVARRLSRAAVETLAIVAYHQPVTRAEIEEIRGVSLSRGTLDTLFESGWVRPVGRRRTPGRPVTWGTTQGFLEHFGLSSLADLPGMDELKAAGLLDTRPAASIIGAGIGDGSMPHGEDADDEDDSEAEEDDVPEDESSALAAEAALEMPEDDSGTGETDTADAADPTPPRSAAG